MEILISPAEQRVLGALIEKSLTTPEYYPMSLNALTNACNQKSSRDPVTEYSDQTVHEAIDRLREVQLGMRMDFSGSRTAKYGHQADDTLTLEPAEKAILCLLLLRGPQTVGQLRQRSERMHVFPDLQSVQETLESMQKREYDPRVLVKPLPLQPGSKEVRFVHTLGPVENMTGNSGSGSVEEAPAHTQTSAHAAEPPPPGFAEELETLRSELRQLREEFEEFKKQFD